MKPADVPAVALCLYLRHPTIMDEFWGADDLEEGFEKQANAERLPREMRELVEKYRDELTKILESLDEEVDQLRGIVLSQLRSVTSGGFQEERTRRSKADWNGKVRVRPSDKRNTRAKTVEVGWTWWTEDNKSFFYPYIWMRGGRKAETLLQDYFKKKRIEGTVAKIIDWEKGTFRFKPFNMTDHFKERDFDIGMNELADVIARHFKWLTKQTLDELFKQSLSLQE